MPHIAAFVSTKYFLSIWKELAFELLLLNVVLSDGHDLLLSGYRGCDPTPTTFASCHQCCYIHKVANFYLINQTFFGVLPVNPP